MALSCRVAAVHGHVDALTLLGPIFLVLTGCSRTQPPGLGPGAKGHVAPIATRSESPLVAPAAEHSTSPYGSLTELLTVDVRVAAVQTRLSATALEPSLPPRVRYAALNSLERHRSEHKAVAVARQIAENGEDPGSGARWLVENAIGVLGRSKTPEARAALEVLATSPVAYKRDVARAFLIQREDRPQ